ncbi:MAG: nucleoside 2-deoxyribosyltransferase [Anaerolineaceae bacterium]|nr:MAG: nucleoside 2-deoxyribosyltransferase [Anaerolineaceae bacterium]
MNVYFACSITGGREFEPVYRAITAALLADRHTVPTAHIAGPDVKALEASVSPREIYARDAAWMRACDALVAEVSTPSHGVGYEVAFALNLGKRVLCLYRVGQSVSKMITGNPAPNLRVVSYRDAGEAVQTIRAFLNLPSVEL